MIDTNEGRLLAKTFCILVKTFGRMQYHTKYLIATRQHGEIGIAELQTDTYLAAGAVSPTMSLLVYGDTNAKEHLRAKGAEPGSTVCFATLRFLQRYSANCAALVRDLANAYKIDLTTQPSLDFS